MKTAIFALCLCACSWDFNGQAPEIQLVGTPPPEGSFVKLNQASARGVNVLTGADSAPWAAIDETPTAPGVPLLGGHRPPVQAVMRLVRLLPPATQQVVTAASIGVSATSLYTLQPQDGQPTLLTILTPGAAGNGQHFALPPEQPDKLNIFANRTEVTFLVWVLSPNTTTFDVYRRDGSFQRTLPVPPGVDPQQPLAKGALVFDAPGDVLYVQDATGRVLAHSTTSTKDTGLGVLPRGFLPDPVRPVLWACDPAGLRSVPADGTPAAVLDPAPCDGTLFRYIDGALYYRVAGPAGPEVHGVTLDPLGPPQVLLHADARQVLAVGPGNALCYSTDPPTLYAPGTGAAWLDGWRFAERGRLPTFSLDHTRLRWLENAADSGNVGELLSAELAGPGADLLHLALNVRQYTEVAPGRVLAIANAAYKGTQDRLIVIDEAAQEAHWVVDSAYTYVAIPGTGDLLVSVITGPGYDILRVPVP